ncbi:unnamed protein product [Dibothriocephalus latus]|uniref:Uncharacterized protein n=1 Tax=Dibothriocephalus latus TaxID=60516 RepID=A0A3P6R755_DIBLA|nr:unnamed protein product [Dibothriocephalus latus]
MSVSPAGLQRGIRFPWTVRRSEGAEGARTEDTSSSRPSTHADMAVTSGISQDIASCPPAQPAATELEEVVAEEEVMMIPDRLVPSTTSAEDQTPEPPSNEDLDELTNSLLAMQQVRPKSSSLTQTHKPW